MAWVEAPSGLITPHFSWNELACRHCNKVPTIATMKKTAAWAEKIRALVKRPMHILSGARCSVHNAEVGGTSGSQHLLGLALDWNVEDLDVKTLAGIVLPHLGVGKLITGLGIYYGKGFIHTDRRWGLPALWKE